ncbi:MAG: hypothetical protein KKG75_01405 [Nanoarchaeota archaeon]|nr:hypothetical protein [Nanoarchaeota archaeon]
MTERKSKRVLAHAADVNRGIEVYFYADGRVDMQTVNGVHTFGIEVKLVEEYEHMGRMAYKVEVYQIDGKNNGRVHISNRIFLDSKE